MDAFDPHNELIDKYLRGELVDQELELFERNLENDPVLHRDVAFRKMLVAGIQNRGSAELKKYIREKTTQRKGRILGYQSWYYAAAAIGLVLIASVVVFISYNNQQAGKQDMASTTVDTSTTQKQIKENNPTPTDAAIAQQEPFVSQGQSEENPTAGDAEGMLDPGSMTVETMSGDTMPVVMAMNISVIPIKIVPAQPATPSTTAEKGGATLRDITKKPATQKDSAFEIDKEKIASTVETGTVKKVDRFKLYFYNTIDMQPQVKLTDLGMGNSEVLVYNLPFDNPLVFNYKDKYYLKTGEKFYELDQKKTGMQKVVAVTDSALLKALNQ